MALIGKVCGYKQYDDKTIKVFRQKIVGVEEHYIPYYCGACQDNATK